MAESIIGAAPAPATPSIFDESSGVTPPEGDPCATPAKRAALRARVRQKAIEIIGIDPDAALHESGLSPAQLLIVRQAQWHAGCAACAALGYE